MEHGRSDELVCGTNLKKLLKKRTKKVKKSNFLTLKLVDFSSVFQNGPAFLRQIGEASLSEFPEICGDIQQDPSLLTHSK
jgi:hypothetical protein